VSLSVPCQDHQAELERLQEELRSMQEFYENKSSGLTWLNQERSVSMQQEVLVARNTYHNKKDKHRQDIVKHQQKVGSNLTFSMLQGATNQVLNGERGKQNMHRRK